MKDVSIFSYLISLGLALAVNYFFTSKIGTISTLQLLINLLVFTFVLVVLSAAQRILKKKKK